MEISGDNYSFIEIGKYFNQAYKFNKNFIETNLLYEERNTIPQKKFEQLSIFDKLLPTKEDKIKWKIK